MNMNHINNIKQHRSPKKTINNNLFTVKKNSISPSPNNVINTNTINTLASLNAATNTINVTSTIKHNKANSHNVFDLKSTMSAWKQNQLKQGIKIKTTNINNNLVGSVPGNTSNKIIMKGLKINNFNNVLKPVTNTIVSGNISDRRNSTTRKK